MPVRAKCRYRISLRRFVGTCYETSSHEAGSLWAVVQIIMDPANDGCELVTIHRVVTTTESLTEVERDTIALLTAGKIRFDG